MSNLLQIERHFLSLPEVSQALRLQEVRSIQRTIENAKKKKFEQSLALSKHVNEAFNWFKSEEGKAKLSEEGISWSAEDFAQKVFGWQKSFFYKMVKVANVPTETIEQYTAQEAEERSVEDLLKFTKQVESPNAEQVERAEITLKLTFAHPDGSLKVTIDENMQVKIKGGENPAQGIEMLKDAVDYILNALNQ